MYNIFQIVFGKSILFNSLKENLLTYEKKNDANESMKRENSQVVQACVN